MPIYDSGPTPPGPRGTFDSAYLKPAFRVPRPQAVAREVRRVVGLGACGGMIGGPAGPLPLNDPAVTPFWDACVEANIPVSVHVAWSWDPLTNFYDQILFSGALGFVLPVLMGFGS